MTTPAEFKVKLYRQTAFIALRFAAPFWVGQLLSAGLVLLASKGKWAAQSPTWYWAQIGIFLVGLAVGSFVSWTRHKEIFSELKKCEQQHQQSSA